MKSIDFHPEHLIDRVVRGASISPSELASSLHLKECVACRFELDLHAALNAESEVLAGDGELIERAVELVVLQLSESSIAQSGDAKHVRGTRRFSPIVLGVGVLFMAAAAAATLGLVLQFVPHRGADMAGTEGRQAPSIEGSSRGAERAPNGVSETAPPAKLIDHVQNSSPAKPGPGAPKERGQSTQLSATLSPAELFEQATALRRGGKATRAVLVFRELLRRYPASPEASASRLSLARLLLEQANDPGGALLQFEAYIRSGGPLEQEALVGQALALERLNRPAEARAVWLQVLHRYPGSTYAKQARLKVESDP